MGRTIIWAPYQALVQTWEGADLTLADRISDVDTWRGPIAQARMGAVLRGTYGTGNRLGWVCTGSKVKSERKGIGTLEITWEPGGPYANPAFLPLDDWKEEAVELYPKVERNKHLRGVSYPGNLADRITTKNIALAYQSVHGATLQMRSDAAREISKMAALTTPPPTGTTWADQSNWTNQLENWLLNGNETYYLAGLKHCYVIHYFTLPETTLGGIIESPSWGPRAGDTTLSWLRLADAAEPIGVNGSAFRVTYTWLGGPGGHWDPVLYG